MKEEEEAFGTKVQSIKESRPYFYVEVLPGQLDSSSWPVYLKNRETVVLVEEDELWARDQMIKSYVERIKELETLLKEYRK